MKMNLALWMLMEVLRLAMSQENAPVDLYMLLDQSDSIRPKMFEQILTFGEDLAFRLSDIFGFYSDTSNGLRVTLVTFGCGEGQSKARIRHSSDEELIRRKFSSIKENVITFENTCLEEALQITQSMLEDGTSIQPPTRFNPLVVLTDGKFDDFDSFIDTELESIKQLPQTRFYTVGIGSAVREEQVVAIAGANDRYYHVDESNTLNNLVEAILAFVQFDSTTEWTGEAVNLDGETSSFCYGDKLSVTLSGSSDTDVLSLIQCRFEFDNDFALSEIVVTDERVYCEVPMEFGLVMSNEVGLSLIYSSGVVVPVELEYSISGCYESEVSVTNDEFGGDQSEFCAGDDISLRFEGESVRLMYEYEDTEVRCVYTRELDGEVVSLYTVTPVREGDDGIVCDGIRWDPYSAPENQYYGYYSMRVGVYGSDNELIGEYIEVMLQSSNGDTNSLCFPVNGHGVDEEGVNQVQTADKRRLQDEQDCWPECCQRDSVEISFGGPNGRSIAALLPVPTDTTLTCIYTENDTNNLITRDLQVDPETYIARCLPAPGWSYSEGGGDYTAVEVIVSSPSTGSDTLVQHLYQPSSGAEQCINTVYDTSTCIGEEISIQISGLTISALFADAGFDFSPDSIQVEWMNETEVREELTVTTAGAVITGSYGLISSEGSYEGYTSFLILDSSEFASRELEDILVTECASGATAGLSSDDDNWWIILVVIMAICLLAVLIFMYAKKRVAMVSDDQIYKVDDRVEVMFTAEEMKNDNNEVTYVKGTVTIVDKVDKRTEESKAADDIEEGKPKKGVFYFYTVKFDDTSISSKDNLEAKSMRMAKSDFKVGNTVKASKPAATTTYSLATVSKVMHNNEYEVKADADSFVTTGDHIVLLQELKFKEGDIVFAKPGKDNDVSYMAEVLETQMLAQKYKIKVLDETYPFYQIKTEYNLDPDRVDRFEFAEKEVVQVQDTESTSTWRRAVIVSKHGGSSVTTKDMTYDVLYSYESIGKESKVAAKRIRRPIFHKNDKVEVVDDIDKTQWQPGLIKEAKPDGKQFDVFLTKEETTKTYDSNSIRHQDMEEVMLRVRKGAPLRSKNYDDTPTDGEGLVPVALRFKRKNPLAYIELPNHQVDITIPSKGGLGVQFGWTEDKRIIVSGYRDMVDGDWGPLEATGLVMLQDQLIKVDKKLVADFGISDLSALLEKCKEKDTVTLRFGRHTEESQVMES